MPRSTTSRDNDSTTKNSSESEDNQNKPWTPPLWLLSSTDQKHAARVAGRSNVIFRRTIPAIPAKQQKALYQAVRQQFPRRHRNKPHAEEQQIRNFQNKIKEQRRKARDLQDKLEELEQLKEQKLKDIRKARQEEARKALDALEVKMREEFAAQVQERKSEWKRALEEECQIQRKRLGEELESKRKKRKEEFEAKKASEAQQASVEQEKETLESDGLKTELEDLKGKVESLNESKTEMIWLLKQVIKAEEKQKATKSAGEKKPEPKIFASKLA